MIANVDLVAGLISEYAPNAEFHAFADAGWWDDINPYDPSVVSLRDQTEMAVNYFNGVADQDCMDYYTENDPDNFWRCFFATYAWPYISSPIFWQVCWQGMFFIIF